MDIRHLTSQLIGLKYCTQEGSKSIFSTWHGISGGGGSDLLAAFGGGSQAHSPSRLQSQGVHALQGTVYEFLKLHSRFR